MKNNTKKTLYITAPLFMIIGIFLGIKISEKKYFNEGRRKAELYTKMQIIFKFDEFQKSDEQQTKLISVKANDLILTKENGQIIINN